MIASLYFLLLQQRHLCVNMVYVVLFHHTELTAEKRDNVFIEAPMIQLDPVHDVINFNDFPLFLFNCT